MAAVTLSGKHQFTLPVDMVRSPGLNPGDKLIAELVDDHVVLLPQQQSWGDYFMGSVKGVYGPTIREIDRYIAEERASPERWEWRQQFDDMLATHPDVEVMVETLRSSPHYTANWDQLRDSLTREKRSDPGDIRNALQMLVDHGAARRIPLDGTVREVYRPVRELAEG